MKAMKPMPVRIVPLLVAASMLSMAEPPAPQRVSFTEGAGNTWNADWIGAEPPRTYFLQWSLDLVHWHYAPLMEFGPGLKSAGIDTQGERRFFIRLHSSDDAAITTLQEARDADFDADGIRNSFEVELFGGNPFVKNIVAGDSDGNGLPDAWETSFIAWLTQFGIPVTGPDPLADYDGDGLSNAEEFMLGTNPFLMDTDGDGIPDGEDPDPLVARVSTTEAAFRVLSVME